MTTRWRIDDPLLPGARRLRVVLVRHGQSDWNAAGLVQGHLGGGLTSRGHADAQLTAQHLARLPRPQALLSSDLERVVETAQPYADLTGMPIVTDPRLREIDNGAWSGLTIDEVVTDFGTDIDQIRAGHDLPRGGGERVADLAARARAVVDDLAASVPDGVEEGAQYDVVAFAHGGSIRALATYALGLPPTAHRVIRGVSNCSVTHLAFWVDRYGGVHSGEMELYNSTAHLDGPVGSQGVD